MIPYSFESPLKEAEGISEPDNIRAFFVMIEMDDIKIDIDVIPETVDKI